MNFNELSNDIKIFILGFPEGLLAVLWGAVRILTLFMIAKYLGKLAGIIFVKVMRRRGAKLSPKRKRRFNTLFTLSHSVLRYGLYIVALAISLDIIGVGNAVAALIATAGIGGLAIGFGAQNLVKDVVTGAFLLFENQFGVGDSVEIAGVTGTVIAVAIRVTYLKGENGETIIVPNGTISSVKNFSRCPHAAHEDGTAKCPLEGAKPPESREEP